MGVREALLKAGIGLAAQIDEALARQQLYGLDIVTNLVELVDLDEAQVQRALSEAFGMTAAPSGELPYAAGPAIELVPRNVATDLNVYPYRLDDGVLTLIASSPLSERTVVDLSFALKVQLRSLFAIAPRVKQAIARDYAFALDRRTQKVLAKLERASRHMISDQPPQPHVRSMSQLPRPRSIAPFGFPENWADAVTPNVAQSTAETARQPSVRVSDNDDLGQAPETSRSLFGAQTEFPGLTSEAPHSGRSTAPSSRGEAPPPSSHRYARRRGPYTVAAAKADLRDARGGDELLDVFFNFAAQYFDYAAVFTLHADYAEVRDARGTGQSLAYLGGKLPLADAPALSAVNQANSWTLCDLRQLDPALARLLLRDTPLQCLLLPIVVRERCLLVLYGGFDSEPVELDAVGELLAFSPLVARAFERAIVAKRAGSRVASEGSIPVRPRRPRFSPPAPEERVKALANVLNESDTEEPDGS